MEQPAQSTILISSAVLAVGLWAYYTYVKGKRETFSS